MMLMDATVSIQKASSLVIKVLFVLEYFSVFQQVVLW